MRTVICIKVGTKYGSDYVNTLQNMLSRHTTELTKVLCLTDDPRGLKTDYAGINTNYPGWWSKLTLFRPHEALPDRVIYLDLDTVIVRNVDWLFSYGGKFAILADFWGDVYNSSVISMKRAYHRHVWDNFKRQYMNEMHGDQDWITRQVNSADLWQQIAPGQIGSYKADHLHDGPGDFSLVCFHGDPKPHTFKEGWVAENWR